MKFSKFFDEEIFTPLANCFNVTTNCNASCIFCSQKQNPPNIITQKIGHRPIDEIEKVLWGMSSNDFPIYLNDGTNARIVEGEALTHPQIFEILWLIRQRFPTNLIVITTNGSLLSEDMLNELNKFYPLKIVHSMTTIDKEKWMYITKLKEHHYYNMVNAIPLIQKKFNNIISYPNFIMMPSLIGYDKLEDVVRYLKEYGCNEAFCLTIGHTKYFKKELISIFHYDKKEISNFLLKMSSKYKFWFEWLLNPSAFPFFTVPYEKIRLTIKNLIFYHDVKEVFLFTSVAAYSNFKKPINLFMKNLPVKINVVPVKNRTFGGNIQVTGLWTIDDLRYVINKLKLKNEYILLPRDFLNRYGFDLAEENINDFQKECKNNLVIIF